MHAQAGEVGGGQLHEMRASTLGTVIRFGTQHQNQPTPGRTRYHVHRELKTELGAFRSTRLTLSCPHLTDGEAEAQRGKGSLAWAPRPSVSPPPPPHCFLTRPLPQGSR